LLPSYSYIPEILGYLADHIGGYDHSFVLNRNDLYLLCPFIVAQSKIELGTDINMPAPCFVGKGSRRDQRILLDGYFELVDNEVKYARVCIDPYLIGQAYVLRAFMEKWFSANVRFTSLVDLTQDTEHLRKAIRKRYWDYIRALNKKYDVGLSTEIGMSEIIFDDWSSLYSMVRKRGKKPVSGVSFKLLKTAMDHGHLIIVSLYSDNKLLSAVELIYAGERAAYFHGATHPKQEGQEALSHLLIWESILVLKKLGVQYLELGPIIFKGCSTTKGMDKEESISHFKKGFGGRIVPIIVLDKSYGDC
jgi:hypothetical protein